MWKSTFFGAGGSLWAQISDGRGRHSPTTVIARKLEWLLFHVVAKYPQCIIWFCHKARVWRTDGRTEVRFPRPRYRGKSIMERRIRANTRIVKTGKMYILVVTTSAVVERFFSTHNVLLTPQRTRLVSETL